MEHGVTINSLQHWGLLQGWLDIGAMVIFIAVVHHLGWTNIAGLLFVNLYFYIFNQQRFRAGRAMNSSPAASPARCVQPYTDILNTMWPFKKKTLQEDIIAKTFETVICIPGNWNDWDEFILTIVAATNGEYLAAGNILINAKKERHFKIEFCEQDEKMKQSFSYAGKVTRVTDNFLDRIGNHKHVIYISSSTGNLEEAGHIAFAAEAILKAGGLGVKIETAGKAFEKDKWHDLLESFEESNLYEMFVLDSIINEDGTVYSCGMQNLGYKDTIVSDEEFQNAVDLIKIFGFYQIVDKPSIQNRQTFSTSIESPKYRITDEPNQPNNGHEQFENPFGMWRLTKE